MCRLLASSGEPYVVFDSLEQGHRAAIGGAEFRRGDLRNPGDLAGVFADYPDIDVVLHFAAWISVGESVREPLKYYRNNTVGVLNLLDAMRAAAKDKIVFSSTAAVYGEPEYVPIDEDHPKNPTSPYGESKLWAERMLAAADRAHGIRSVCLRYFNASGADPSAEIGEDHHPEEHLIPLAIAAAAGTRPALKVFGTDWDTPDGTCVRDYVHVNDLAEAHLLAVRHLRAGGESRVYNLGNGQGFSVREVLRTVGEAVGRQVPAEDAPRRPGDPARLIASSERIRRDWGWTPRYPDLREIVDHAWAWHRSHPNGYGDRV
jgi:UDP-glucose 4-epimerase